jgi:hypothetical protein
LLRKCLKQLAPGHSPSEKSQVSWHVTLRKALRAFARHKQIILIENKNKMFSASKYRVAWSGISTGQYRGVRSVCPNSKHRTSSIFVQHCAAPMYNSIRSYSGLITAGKLRPENSSDYTDRAIDTRRNGCHQDFTLSEREFFL